MEETYRMLAREHELDLEREAARRRLAAALPPRPARAKASAEAAYARRARFALRSLVVWLAR